MYFEYNKWMEPTSCWQRYYVLIQSLKSINGAFVQSELCAQNYTLYSSDGQFRLCTYVYVYVCHILCLHVYFSFRTYYVLYTIVWNVYILFKNKVNYWIIIYLSHYLNVQPILWIVHWTRISIYWIFDFKYILQYIYIYIYIYINILVIQSTRIQHSNCIKIRSVDAGLKHFFLNNWNKYSQTDNNHFTKCGYFWHTFKLDS